MREPVPRPSSDRPDRAAFEALYRSTGSAVLGYALRRAASPDDAHDAVAETYTVAWRRRADTPVDPDEVRPWLFGIARRCLADIDRSAARATRLGAKLADAFVVGTIPDPAVGEDYAPVRAAMAGLPDADRELVSLVAWEGLTLPGSGRAGPEPGGHPRPAAPGPRPPQAGAVHHRRPPRNRPRGGRP
ncbi:RNA polymerase sigma factor [Klenkia terrae]|uniref:RNA polymerase sigma factor n=1 Tax=Klenkia terrae TaxID=1052259 RepID=UPI0036094703